jgi:Rieske Fe-S protein
MERTGISRRGALTSAASLGVALPMLAACGDDAEEPTDASSPIDRSETTERSEPTSPATEPSAEASGDGGGGLATTAEVPVGGGLILAEQKLVITQPTKGDFKGFTAVCTHMQCLVAEVTKTIDCPCHGSQFSIENGEPVAGPAATPLEEMPLAVDGNAIDLA